MLTLKKTKKNNGPFHLDKLQFFLPYLIQTNKTCILYNNIRVFIRLHLLGLWVSDGTEIDIWNKIETEINWVICNVFDINIA